MTTLTTTTGTNLKVSSNKSKRYYTIVTETAKFITNPMSREEFDNNAYNTGQDWKNFLKTDDYYEVK